MSNKTVAIVGSIVVPLVLALCASMVFVVNALATNSAQDTANAQRVEQLEGAQRAHAASAARIEETVTKMRVEQARFVGNAQARIKVLEGHHD